MKKTILTIDDQADIRRLVRMTLEYDGYTVLEASEGAEGLALARSRRPDLILLDVMMPGVDGLMVGKTLQADPVLSRIPVIMLTALDRDADIDAGLEVGVRAYLCKPFGPVELLQMIESFIQEADGAATAPSATAPTTPHFPSR
ncbi:response regulator [Curvibacter sp. HBC61]|uniref:Response regulator n=1 Tax=Curvibacter cyanobacteriorum TaxID=3026422 RepID=A0ABT5N0E2_9BURK|nr:response regulator [Curvibacter sp. HBC61]MDD0839787.1 response regulator [Curvibacter sp. HBC61]